MALGASLFMIAVGAILTFAINASIRGMDLTAIGVIFMVVGFLGVAMSMLFLASFAPFYRGPSRGVVVREEVTHDVIGR
ncbi:MAG: hypothetical protein EPO65_01590 [Dehalococcoidia bacterium]|nr:MAG: hypothetical protein EPO65_01590 [Dehalococcoidia bacterium]